MDKEQDILEEVDVLKINPLDTMKEIFNIDSTDSILLYYIKNKYNKKYILIWLKTINIDKIEYFC